MTHQTAEELEAGLPMVTAAPRGEGQVRLIVRRTGRGEREILDVGVFDRDAGLVGDEWSRRPTKRTGAPDPAAQVTIMNARYCELITGHGGLEAWALAGDQLYVDLDLSEEHLPAGSRLAVGSTILEIQSQPHTGCAQFSARFGSEALRLANSELGRALRLRGANAVVVQDGVVRSGDLARKV